MMHGQIKIKFHWIILDVTSTLTVIRLTRRVWSSDWVTDNDSVMSDDGESDE